MSDVRCRRPGMGKADRAGFRTGRAGFKGGQKALTEGNFLRRRSRQKILPCRRKPSENHALADMRKRPRLKRQGHGAVHVAFPRPLSHGRLLADRCRSGCRHAGSQRPAARSGLVKHLPLFFDLAGRRVVVVGQGPAADRRAELARSVGAAVFQLEKAGSADLKGAAAVFVATGDLDSDTGARRAAKTSGVPVNVADRPGLSDFILPAIIDRNEVVVAVSTGGASPSLATLLRARIEALLPERIGALARLAQTFRAQANALILDPARRRTFWRRLVDGPAPRLVLSGDDAAAGRGALGELDDARRALNSLGIAHIVGAGPGDPAPLTLRAAPPLHGADALLHARLVPAPLLHPARLPAPA